MKKSILKTTLGLIALSPLLLNAAELEDVDVSAMPNTFSNGEPANADEVNANFEYLRNNMDLLIQLLEEQKTLRSDANRRTGTYTVTGLEINTACDDSPNGDAFAVTFKAMGGTAVASASSLDLTLTLLSQDPLITANTTLEVEPRGGEESDSFSLPLESNGSIGGGVLAGGFSADGNSFSLVGGEGGCGGNLTYITGLRN